MADDIKINLGLDASGLTAGLQKVLAELNKLLSTKIDFNEEPAIADLNKIEAEAKQTGDAIDKNLGNSADNAKGKFGGLGDLFKKFGGDSVTTKDAVQSLSGGISSLVPGLGSLSGVLTGGGIGAGLLAIGGGIAYTIDKGKEFETQLASLSSITGVSGAGLQDLGDKAKVMAAKFGTDATANIESFKTILSKLGPDIAKSPEALNSMAESVNTLSKATGDTPGAATEALTTSLLQFGVSLDDPKKAAEAMSVAMNVLAAGAKEGASEVPDVAAAINVAGVAAKGAKVSFEETNSAIQVLAAGGKVGAEAGTSLRNVLNKLGEGRFLPKDVQTELNKAGVDINKLGDTSVTLSERLRELNKISTDSALKTKLFGTDAAAATILIQGANGSMDDLTKKITNTTVAFDQAATNMATFDEQLNRLKSGIDNFAISFYDSIKQTFGMLAESTGPSIGKLVETIGGAFERIWSVIGPILGLIGAGIMTGISNAITIAAEVVNGAIAIISYAFDVVVQALKPLTDGIKSALGMDGAMGQGIDTVKMLQDAMNFMSEVIRGTFSIILEFGKLILDFIIAPFKLIIEVVADVTRSIGGWLTSNNESNESIRQTGTATDKTKTFVEKLREAFDNIRGTIGGVRGAFEAIQITISKFWDFITKLDFKSAFDVIGNAGAEISKGYEKGFNSTKEAIKKTNDEVKKGGGAFEQFQTQQTEAEKKAAADAEAKRLADEKKKLADANKPKGAAKEKASELEQLKEFYKDKQEAQKNDIERELADEKNKYADKKVLRAKLEAEANTELRKFLNERIGGINDAETFLKESQLTVKITPSKAKGETVEDINTFYTQEIVKLRKGLEVETKYKIDIPTFKEQLKEVETISKDFAATAEKLVPITISGSSEELAQVQQDVINFQEFLKAQNLEIAQLQQEAQIAGNEEAAQKFAEAINKNVQSINLLESRVKTFAEKTKEAQKQNTLEYQIATALQTSLLDTFNADKLRKEKETNEAMRKERLGALDAEENDLNKSLAKREISAEEYAAKLSEINNGRQKAQEETEVTVLQRLKQAGDKVVGDVLKTQGAAFTEQAKKMEGGSKIMYEAMGGLATSFGALAASGKATLKDFAGASVDIAVQAMMKMIPIWTAEIFATSVAELGVGGLAVAAGLQILLMGLVSAARSAGGFKDGVVGLDGAGTETSDSIPAWLSRGESVITARATKNNKEELEFMNRTGLSIAEFYKMRMPSTSVSVTPDGDLIREVRKLREETRGLGVRIQRNTSVEVSGVLTADSKSINALIVEQKRRSARRG